MVNTYHFRECHGQGGFCRLACYRHQWGLRDAPTHGRTGQSPLESAGPMPPVPGVRGGRRGRQARQTRGSVQNLKYFYFFKTLV